MPTFHGDGKALLPPIQFSFFIPEDGMDDQPKKDNDHKDYAIVDDHGSRLTEKGN